MASPAVAPRPGPEADSNAAPWTSDTSDTEFAVAFNNDTAATTPANSSSTLPTTPFRETTRKGLGDENSYQSINFMPEYSNYSFEELRLTAHEKGQTDAGATGNGSPFGDGSSSKAGYGLTFTTRFVPKGLPASGTGHGSERVLAKPLKYGDNSVVKVVVGSGKISFSVHKDFVCEVSPFFQSACKGQFKEALDDEVHLPEADPEAFDIFMEWIYTRTIKFPNWPLAKDSISESSAWWSLVSNIYILAGYLQCTSFGNDLIDWVSFPVTFKHIPFFPGCEVINSVYRSTTGSCGLRRLFVALNVWPFDVARWRGDDWWRAYLNNLVPEYSQDLVISLLRKEHGLDQDPFANVQTCLVFRDADGETRSEALKQTLNDGNRARTSVQKLE